MREAEVAKISLVPRKWYREGRSSGVQRFACLAVAAIYAAESAQASFHPHAPLAVRSLATVPWKQARKQVSKTQMRPYKREEAMPQAFKASGRAQSSEQPQAPFA